MATIDGSFSNIGADKVKPYIDYSLSQNIAGNYTDVTAQLHFQRPNPAYYGNNNTGSATANNEINGDRSNANINFTLGNYSGDPSNTDVVVRSRTVRVYHDANGSKSCYIGFDGDTGLYWGDYSFGQVVALPTIPREASVTNAVSFQVGNNIPLTINNPGNLYLKIKLYVNGSLIKTVNAGQVSSYTITPSGGENSSMYAQIPNATSCAMFVRIDSYSDSGYSTQVGGDRDQAGTMTIDQSANAPTFTTYTVANVDKTISNTDKYSNSLVSSSTATLLGSSTKMIKGYSKIRATITTGNKMVAKNSATAIKYRFVAGSLQSEQPYSSGSTVSIDIDNADVIANTVTAFDSRSLSTVASNALSYIANYFPVSLFGLTLARDNGIDAPVTLSFSGLMFKEYFGGGTSGVLNTVTCHYRYKETTVAWAAQTWNSITPTVDGSGNISFSGYIDGDLGSSGFDTSKSFDIEVRIYDKLTNTIITDTLSVGTPLIDFTQDGAAILSKYDVSESGLLQLGGLDIARMLVPVGGSIMWNSIKTPKGYLVEDGSAISRSTYAALFAAIVPVIGTFTVTAASPGVFTLNSHNLSVGDQVYLTTTGALLTGLSANTLYYVTNPTTNTFNLSTSFANALAGTKINTSGTQSGVHTLRSCPFGLGDGSTTFNLPASKGRVPVGVDNSQDEFKILGILGGSKTHTLSVTEMPSHTHTQNSHTHTQTVQNTHGVANGSDWTTVGTGSDPTGSTTATNQNTGGGGAHNNLQPLIGKFFIIRYK